MMAERSRPRRSSGNAIELGVTINLNRLAGGVTDDIAVVAPGKMIFELGLSAVVENAVEITSQFLKEFGAFHWLPSPLGLARFNFTAVFTISILTSLKITSQPFAQLQACPKQPRFYRRNTQLQSLCRFFG